MTQPLLIQFCEKAEPSAVTGLTVCLAHLVFSCAVVMLTVLTVCSHIGAGCGAWVMAAVHSTGPAQWPPL